jgi:hypothetical protein
VLVTPNNGATGSFKFWLAQDKTGTLTVGTPSNLSIDTAGQNLRYTFAGTVGQSLAVDIAGLNTLPAGQYLWAGVYRLDTKALVTAWTTYNGTQTLAPLPVTGDYALVLEVYSNSNNKGAATASLQVLLDPGTALPLDNTAINSTISTTGATARYTFTASTGQNFGLAITDLVLTPGTADYVRYSVYYPNGTLWTSDYCYINGNNCSGNLPITTPGTYSVLVTPYSGATGSFKFWLTQDKTGTLTAGTPSNLTIDTPGQNLRYTFAGTSGQSLALDLSNLVTTPSGQIINISVFQPNATPYWTAWDVGGSGAIHSLPTLPSTGTYTVFMQPHPSNKGAATGSVTVNLH